MEPSDHNLRAWEEAHRRRAPAAPGSPGLPDQVRRALGDLNGKRVLHVGCGSGAGTAELAERGAVVTGVDLKGEALDAARELWPSILWVEADPQDLPAELRRGRFDLAYAGGGSLDAITDLGGWARGVAAVLRARGELLVFDEHPIAPRLDPLMRWHNDYFEGAPRLGKVVPALARAGIVTRALEEYPSPPGNPRRHDRRIPGEFLLYADKEAT